MGLHTIFNNGRILSEEEMFKTVPAIFAVGAHESRSEKFRPIPTIEVLRALAKEGFMPVSAQQQGARREDRREFGKHLVRMRRFDDNAKNLQVGDTTAEFVLMNANDGTSVYNLKGGLFRVACLNGMVCELPGSEFVKVRHSLNDPSPRAIIDNVIEGTYRVLTNIDTMLDAPRNWSKVELTAPQTMQLANRAHRMFFRDVDGVVRTAVKPEQLLHVKREADRGNDMWRVFNRIQEWLLKGGIESVSYSDTSRWGKVETRSRTHPINAIDRNVKVNTSLFDIGRRFYEEVMVLEDA